MHGYPDWFMWLVVTVYYGMLIAPLAVLALIAWSVVRKMRK